jgi:3-oxoacyl-ACP reductase-like protein
MQPPADAPDLHDTTAGLPVVEAPTTDQRVPAPRGPEPVAAPTAVPPADTAAAAAAAAAVTVPAVLSEREVQILAFESKWWKHAGSKEQAVRDTFGLSSTRYYQLLNGLLDNPAALAHDPVLVGRLRRLRSTRARTRRR